MTTKVSAVVRWMRRKRALLSVLLGSRTVTRSSRARAEPGPLRTSTTTMYESMITKVTTRKILEMLLSVELLGSQTACRSSLCLTKARSGLISITRRLLAMAMVSSIQCQMPFTQPILMDDLMVTIRFGEGLVILPVCFGGAWETSGSRLAKYQNDASSCMSNRRLPSSLYTFVLLHVSCMYYACDFSCGMVVNETTRRTT